MKKNRIIKSGFRAMGRHKMRTFFMMTGILVGITALTLIISLGKGTKQELMGKIEKLFSANNIIITAGGGMQKGPRFDGRVTTLTLEDVEVLRDEVPNIEMYDPMQMIPQREVKYRDKSINTRIFGQSPASEQVWNRSVVSGEFIDEGENKRAARTALLGTKVASELFGDSDPVGEQIRIGNVPFKVKGILEEWGTDLHGLNRDNEILVPITTAMRRLMNVDYIRNVKIQLADPNKMEQTESRIRGILRERHHLTPEEPDDFMIITPVLVQKIVAGANNIFDLFLPLIAGISLLVGGVVAAGLMLISVNERTGEIGLRKAVGARSKDIQLQFLIETAAVTVSGGIIGILLGNLGVQVFAAIMKLPAVVAWEALLLGIFSSALVGLAAGVFPARRAAGLEPVDALR
ncbi:MAG: FtsX-like permease family protein [bacterium]|nr:FtsX-like permease family protein [bacterium]